MKFFNEKIKKIIIFIIFLVSFECCYANWNISTFRVQYLLLLTPVICIVYIRAMIYFKLIYEYKYLSSVIGYSLLELLDIFLFEIIYKKILIFQRLIIYPSYGNYSTYMIMILSVGSILIYDSVEIAREIVKKARK